MVPPPGRPDSCMAVARSAGTIPGDPMRGGILATARLPTTLVVRRRLLERLPAPGAQGRPLLTVLTAPPGAGKTVLLADWASRLQTPVAWVSLEEPLSADEFWELLRTAVTELDGRGARAGRHLRPSAPQPAPDAMAYVLEALWERAGTTVVIDNFDRLADPEAASIPAFVSKLPPHACLVVANRGELRMALHRLRLNGDLVEVSAHELRFELGEATELVELVSGRRFTAHEVAALVEDGEGWAVGLRLAALSAREHPEHGLLRSASEAGPLLDDYFRREVLGDLTSGVVDFVLDTSVLETLTGPLCSAVTERSDSLGILAELSRRGLFVHDLDGHGRRFRYHRMFQRFLRRELHERDPEVPRRDHLRAAHASEQTGDAIAAVTHYVAAGADRAASLALASAALEQWEKGLTIRPALPDEELLDDWLAGGPARMYLWAALLQSSLCLDDAAQWLGRLEQRLEEGPDKECLGPRFELLSLVQRVMNMQVDELEVSLSRVQASLDETGQLPPLSAEGAGPELTRLEATMVSMLPDLAAYGHLWRGELDEAHRSLEQTGLPKTVGAVSRECVAASLAFEEGQLRAAYAQAHDALERATRLGADRSGVGLVARRLLGAVHLERDELEVADEYLSAARELADEIGNKVWRSGVELEMVRLRLAQRRNADALAIIGRIRWFDAWAPLPLPLKVKLTELDVSCRLLLEDIDTASGAAAELGDGCPAATLTRIALRAGRPDHARASLEQVRQASLTPRQAIEHQLLTAGTELQQGHTRAAQLAVLRSLELARHEWYVRTFLDEGDGIMNLVREISQRYGDPYSEQLARKGVGSRQSAASAPDGLMLEPLTVKEREVLSRLTSHLSLQDIAGELYVSLNTVKTHVRSVYRKLGVSTRTGAVAAARGYGLL